MSAEWVAAIAALWAAVATTWAAIATSKAITATKKAPVDAAHVAASLQEASERTRLQWWVFGTVMQNRHFLGEVQCVKAPTLIVTLFPASPVVPHPWAPLSPPTNHRT